MCSAKIRPFPAPSVELVCEQVHDPRDTDPLHQSTLRDYAYPGSVTMLSWYESDRRTFRGMYSPCMRIENNLSLPTSMCVLPSGHRGRCEE